MPPPAPRPSTLSKEGLDSGYRQLYNLQFAAARQTFAAWTSAHPADPLGPASSATTDLFADMNRLQILQSQFFSRDHDFFAAPQGPPDPDFEAALAQAESLAQRAPAADHNALYALALCHGLQSDYDGLILKRYLASLGEMKKGEAVARRLLALDPNYADAYLAIGVENYVLSLKPAPVRWLLRLDGASTDRQQGLQQLRLTARQGHYLRPYAQILLALAALRDRDSATARGLLINLAANFPGNPLYAQELVRLDHGLEVHLDPAQTQIHFTLGAFLHTVHGTFTLAQGSLQLDPSTGVATGLIQIHASTGQSGDAARDRDMQQGVLESAKYPDITFTPTHLDGALPMHGGDAHLTLHGVLRLHGQDHDLALPIQAHLTAGHFTATTKIPIPYVAWGLHDPSNLLLHVAKVVQLTIQTSGTIAGDLDSPPHL